MPLYSPGDTPTYSGHTPGHSGITPGYSGPSPDDNPLHPRGSSMAAQHSPVYTGPPPGLMSNASTPGHAQEQEDFVEPRYTPSYQANYTPSNPGTPTYNPGTPSYNPGTPTYSPRHDLSPGNATPMAGNSTPGTSGSSPVAGPSGMGGAGAGGGAGGSGSASRPGTSSNSPQIQQPEVTGNTTPHPGTSQSPGEGTSQGRNNPRYLW